MNEHGHSQSRRRAFARGQANDFDEKRSWNASCAVEWHWQMWTDTRNETGSSKFLYGWELIGNHHRYYMSGGGFNMHPVHCQHSAMLEETPFKRIPAHLYTSTTLALGIQLVFVMPFDLSFPRRREGDTYFHQLTNGLSSQGTKWNWVPEKQNGTP